jgi:gluconate 2-dehydrogenase gamma chain
MADHNKNKAQDPNQADTAPLVSRRNLLKQAGLVGAAAIGSSTAGTVSAAAASSAATSSRIPVREAFETLTSVESDTLDAVVDRILPSDENGPGAREARATHYIDRALAGFRAADRESYGLGLLAIDEEALLRHGNPFHRLSAAQQDALLQAVEKNEIEGFESNGSAFFSMVRNHTIEGTFSDPYYGGNRDYVGWDMLGYPGVRMGASPQEVTDEETIEPSRQSAYDLPPFTKQPVAASGGARNGH